MSDRDKKLLIYLGALIILAAAYFLVGKPYLDKIDKLSGEKTQLQMELTQKRDAYEKQNEFNRGIAEANEKINSIISEFPEDNTDEKTIMFASRAETEIPIWFNQINFAEETKNLISGQESETESASDVEQQQVEENVAANEEEGNSDETSTPEALEVDANNNDTGISDLMARKTEVGLTFEVQYDAFKRLLAYIRDYDDRMVIKDINVSYNDYSGLVTGSMVLAQYAILGPGRELPEVETNVENFGTDNVFTNSRHGGTILDLLADMYSDFLSKLLGDVPEEEFDSLGNDYFVKVNAVTDNTNGKTIGRSDDSEETTYITSASNTKEDVTFKVSGEGGSYSVYYKVGKTEYTDKISKSQDEKIYLRIISTSRMDDEDESAVSAHVINESDIPVIVNIEGDDANYPRVSVMERVGNVTINGGN